ncbi:hypothetical protein LC040_00980 [Bacillus tianshenii]|nr:hypothetical protein LC040_00980 [Bacillus tianshenii]
MGRILENDRKALELSIFLPMVLTVLTKDLNALKQVPFKLNEPYVELIEETQKHIQNDLRKVKQLMKIRNLKAFKEGQDDVFSQYLFIYNGYEEKRNYFNPKIRHNVELLMKQYFLKKDGEFFSEKQLFTKQKSS